MNAGTKANTSVPTMVSAATDTDAPAATSATDHYPTDVARTPIVPI
jgi:hypothetical protein